MSYQGCYENCPFPFEGSPFLTFNMDNVLKDEFPMFETINELSQCFDTQLRLDDHPKIYPENKLFGQDLESNYSMDAWYVESIQSLFEIIDLDQKQETFLEQEKPVLILDTTKKVDNLSKINKVKITEVEDINVSSQVISCKPDSTSAESQASKKVKRSKKASKKKKTSKSFLACDEISTDATSDCSSDISDQILRGLNGDFSLTGEDNEATPTKRRGRPEIIKDVSQETLGDYFRDFTLVLLMKGSSDQRIDAKTASVARQLKKVSDVFLKHIGSKCQYKSKKLNVVVRAYLKSFVLGFCKYFHLEDAPNKEELFLHYIALCFPESKVRRIIDCLVKQGFKPCEYFEPIKASLKLRKLAAKWSFQELFKANSCFKIIESEIIVLAPELNPSASKDTLEILKKLMD